MLQAFLIIFSCLYSTLVTADPVLIDRNIQHIDLDERMRFFIDDHQPPLPFDTIANSPTLFKDIKTRSTRFLPSSLPHWGQVEIINRESIPTKVILHAHYAPTQKISVYMMTATSTQAFKFGPWNKPHSKSMKSRLPAISLAIPPGKTTMFIKVETQTSVQMDFTISKPKSFWVRMNSSGIIVNVWYGVFIGLFFYHIFLFSLNPKRVFFYYTALLFFYGMAQSYLHGTAYQIFSNTNPEWIAKLYLSFLILALLSSAQFTRYFLASDKRIPIMSLFLNTACVMCIPALIFTWIDYQWGRFLLTILAVLVSASISLTALISLFNQYIPAYFFSIGWIFYISGNLIQVSVIAGWIPSSVFTEYASLLGSGIEVIILSLAVGYKLRLAESLQRKAEFENTLIQRDLNAAREVQKSFAKKVPNIENYLIESHYQPAIQIGGDWYSFHHDPINHLAFFYIGDVTGHGLASAMVTGSVAGSIQSSTILSQGKEKLDPTSHLKLLASTANKTVLAMAQESRRWMTMNFICIDYQKNHLYFLNAGHPFPLMKSRDRVTPLVARGSPLGVAIDSTWDVLELDIEAGDRILIYTDGLIENLDRRGSSTSIRQLIRVVESLKDSHELKAALLNIVQDFAKTEDTDDSAFIILDRVS
ncbi:PP2C family protein-serine/threonine phosphatase [Pseudobacteriovorax antillogorgiicola]|uniref:Serine phosphatase RsbU, regulator of sigma subunit n=1 Tax=Pseudobacteriovorax antillogorgiicola TaxID=1513793 RepID=A0A1Y6BL11_9BACT|nr:SpoIIE family protein phosphatase [Pseudobacteriovorax antillogorgiicola]TCS56201.1 serine phosphatase RsbU (regulator of sigma subunit) [Pseudobacteriovorax antillogorgiicola]SMF08674.1 Serine phosphatase RsbU, regulator of sigma subunit [Pseudobacteriovorax antillogorgiicola]